MSRVAWGRGVSPGTSSPGEAGTRRLAGVGRLPSRKAHPVAAQRTRWRGGVTWERRGTAVAGALLLAVFGAAGADSFSVSGYSAGDLLSPCQEADNDARWGEAAETECEQYILGFVDAMQVAGATGTESGICPPEVNTPDEVRWAFMRWVHGDYSARTRMPAADALLETLKSAFECG